MAVEAVDPAFAGALSAFLSSHPVFEVVATGGPDVVVTDVSYLEHGLVDPEAATLMLGPDDPETMLAALDYGAFGYLPEGSPLDEIADAVRAVAEGQAVVPPLMLGSLLRHVVQRRRAGQADLDRLATLTEREREVFDLLAAGLDRSSIAARLYISVGTVRSHLQRVFRKLDVHTHAEAVALAARCGLITHDPEEQG